MKTNIRYSIIGVLFWIAALSISLIGIVTLLPDIGSYLWVAIVLGALFLISVIMLLDSIKNIQWFDITDGYISVYNPFGIIKRVQISQIKNMFKTNAVIWNIRMLATRREHIVLCLNKSVAKGLVYNAYNRKKKPYIILPYTEETKDIICSEYKKICGDNLTIKQ